MVGVNAYVEDDGVAPSTLSIDPAVEADQLEPSGRRQAGPRRRRRAASLARLAKEAADPEVNLMPALIEAARRHVTVGETMRALESVFGIFVERHVA